MIGARVAVVPLLDEISNAQALTLTNEEGEFELQLPSGARRAWVLVSAPGKTLQTAGSSHDPRDFPPQNFFDVPGRPSAV